MVQQDAIDEPVGSVSARSFNENKARDIDTEKINNHAGEDKASHLQNSIVAEKTSDGGASATEKTSDGGTSNPSSLSQGSSGVLVQSNLCHTASATSTNCQSPSGVVGSLQPLQLPPPAAAPPSFVNTINNLPNGTPNTSCIVNPVIPPLVAAKSGSKSSVVPGKSLPVPAVIGTKVAPVPPVPPVPLGASGGSGSNSNNITPPDFSIPAPPLPQAVPPNCPMSGVNGPSAGGDAEAGNVSKPQSPRSTTEAPQTGKFGNNFNSKGSGEFGGSQKGGSKNDGKKGADANQNNSGNANRDSGGRGKGKSKGDRGKGKGGRKNGGGKDVYYNI